MPIVTRLPDEEVAFMERLRSKHADRLPGLHVTDAIWCNIRAIVKPALIAAGTEIRFSDAKILQFETGKLWESVLLKGAWRQQYQIGSPDDDSVGTVDGMLPHTWFPIEVKTTKGSSLAELPDATLMQVGEYAARCMLKHEAQAEVWHGELRILHLNGDCGKNKCLAHGYPETETRRLNPESNRQKLCCPICEGWLSGDQKPEERRHALSWTRDELLSLHRIITYRLGEVKVGRKAFSVRDSLPEWQHGYPKTECPDCEIRDLVNCPSQEDTDEMETEMKGSLTAREGVPA